MNSPELIQAFIATGQKLDALWEFFVTVHLAMYGALFFLKSLRAEHVFISFVAYLFFTWINLRAKLNEYELYNALLSDIKALGVGEANNLAAFINGYHVDDRAFIVCLVHALSLAAFSYLVFSINRNERVKK